MSVQRPGELVEPAAVLLECRDEDFAALLAKCDASAEEVLVVVNRYTAALFGRPDAAAPWSLRGMGDFGGSALDAGTSLIRRGRFKWATTGAKAPDEALVESLEIAVATKRMIQAWLKDVEAVTVSSKGRAGEVPPDVGRRVAMQAAWRCQFAGCGKDLSTHFATGTKGNFSYLAHIVASSPEGPRGDSADSVRLASAEENVMLLCDECHRLIDRVAPAQYSAQALREMKASNVATVRRLLDSLEYPEVEPIMLVGNISGQVHHFSSRDTEQALLQAGLRQSRSRPEFFCRNGDVLHDPHSAGYWDSLFGGLRIDIPGLQRLLTGTGTNQPRPRLAVFPLHGTSILILGGRLIGDTGGVDVFQFHRDQVARNAGGQWAWPASGPEPDANKYGFLTLRPSFGGDEACLLVSLTYDITPDRLTEACFADGQLKLPTIKVTADRFGGDVIQHPKDLELFGAKLDEALRLLQDEWKVRRIHLFVGAPASSCFRVGQKMQARHQATFVCHETGTGRGSPFMQTIEILSDKVIGPSGQWIAF